MRGDTQASPFVSVLRDADAGATSTDPWLQTIITGQPGMQNVSKAPDLGVFMVPRSKLVAPRSSNVLSTKETEMVFHGDDLKTYQIDVKPNPY